MSTIYFKVQIKNEAIPLFRTIKEVGNYKTYLCGDGSPDDIYAIEYKEVSFEILSVRITDKTPSGVSSRSLSQCKFIHLPIEIQKEMVNRSALKSIIPFLLSVTADYFMGGFNWANTPEGLTFWEDIIQRKNFDLFFQLKDNKTNLKQQQNENENQLQKEGIPQSGGSEPRKTGILCRGHKAKITIGHLSNQARLGRG